VLMPEQNNAVVSEPAELPTEIVSIPETNQDTDQPAQEKIAEKLQGATDEVVVIPTPESEPEEGKEAVSAPQSVAIKPFGESEANAKPQTKVANAEEVKAEQSPNKEAAELKAKPKASAKTLANKPKLEKKLVEKPAKLVKVEKKVKKTTAPKPTKPAAITNQPHGFAVQLGVFGNPKNVERMKAKIALAGYESITSSVVKNDKKLTRLRVGYFISREGAERALRKLKENDLSGAVVLR